MSRLNSFKFCLLTAVLQFVFPIFPRANAETLQVDANSRKISIGAALNQQTKWFGLDTGASDTIVAPDRQTEVLHSKEKVGLSSLGKGEVFCSVITVANFEFASLYTKNANVLRCNGSSYNYNNLGMDLLIGHTWSLQFKAHGNSDFSLIPSTPSNIEMKPFDFGPHGHIKLPVNISGSNTLAIFDTGSETTAVDRDFIAANPEMFKLIVESNMVMIDSAGNRSRVPLYSVEHFKIGDIDFGYQEVIAIHISNNMQRNYGYGVGAIIGANTMMSADWILNLKDGLWTAMLHEH